MTRHHFTTLILGDEFITGENLHLHQCFPYLTIQQLRSEGFHLHAPEIMAARGWTTSELAEQLIHAHLNEKYDFVVLLAGMNDIIKDALEEDLKSGIEFLIRKALHFTEINSRVIVSSLPWVVQSSGVNPSAIKKLNIALPIYNDVIEQTAKEHAVRYIDINTKDGEASLINQHQELKRKIVEILREEAGKK